MEYLIHHVKFEMQSALCKPAILFSTVKLKLRHNLYQPISRFKIGTRLNVESWYKMKSWSQALRMYFQIFPNSQRYRKLGFFEYQLRLYFQIFPNSLNIWEIGIFQTPLLLYLVRLWRLSFRQVICDGQGSRYLL